MGAILDNPELCEEWKTQGARDMLADLWQLFEPKDVLSVCEWADRYRFMSGEYAARPGKYMSDFAPYQREPMEACTEQGVGSLVLMWASQTGKTEVIMNILGYFIQREPCPILLVQPTLELAEAFAKERLVPTIRDTPTLKDVMGDPYRKSSDNTMTFKSFPGGNLAIVGSNSPAGLAGRPRRLVVQDEVDRFPSSSGSEGDPCSLADRRTESFYNALLVKTSTPTIKGLSRIEAEYNKSDQRLWHVKTPCCGVEIVLKWNHVKWEDGKPETAHIECPECKARINDTQRTEMVLAGRWIPTNPNAIRGHRGYHLNGINSVFPAKKQYDGRLHQMVVEFLSAYAGGFETRKTWVNTFLGETYEIDAEAADTDALTKRRESMASPFNKGILLLTSSTDVQKDRLEVTIVGWGVGYESWIVSHHRLWGDTLQDEVWDDLEKLLKSEIEIEGQGPRAIDMSLIDSGYNTQKVYEFVRRKGNSRIWPIKGSDSPTHEIFKVSIRAFRKRNNAPKLMTIGTIKSKMNVINRLKVLEPGPNYVHIPTGNGVDNEWVDQLAAEKVVIEYRRGFPFPKFTKVRERNEALDLMAYNYAAVCYLRPDWERLVKKSAKVESVSNPPENTPKPTENGANQAKTKPNKAKKRSNFWRL